MSEALSLIEKIARRIAVNENGCHIWQGARAKGYGQVCYNGATIRTHRATYEYAKGPIPEHLDIDHLCRTPACCNPDHLEAVTPAENCRRGIRTKITQEQAALIRQSWERSGVLGARYGVAPDTIKDIRNGRTWKS